MRPGEIFGLTWGRLEATSAEVTQRIYRGKVDTPKTHNSVRKAALGEDLLSDLEEWRDKSNRAAAAFVFASGTRNGSEQRQRLAPEYATGFS